MSSALTETTLAKCPLFKNMTSSERSELLGLLEQKAFQPGEAILAEGETQQHIGIVLVGRCQVAKKLSNGEGRELSVLEPWSVFGEMSFFNPGPHSATVRALTEVQVALMSRENYDMLLRIGSLAAYKLAFNTMGVVIDRLRKMDEWVCQRIESQNGSNHHEEWEDFQSKLYAGWRF